MKEKTERLGVGSLDIYFSRKGWLFREQIIHDYGIDAHVEIVNDSYPTGELIAIQIKSGLSFFSEETKDSYVFRTEDKHINYWGNHSLPVIIVMYHPSKDIMFWQVINDETIINTGKKWKILIPKKNILDDSSLKDLKKLTQPEPYIQKINKLKLDKSWIEKVAEDEEVLVSYDDWINKSLSRYEITISCNGSSQSWPMTYGERLTIDDALSYFIPWADFEMDLDAYYDARELGYDMEPDGIVPIDSNGEVESYSLRLSLNEIGRSFLELDSFLNYKDIFDKKTFTIDNL